MSHLFIKINCEEAVDDYVKAVGVFNAKKDSPHRDSGFDLFVPTGFSCNFNDTYKLDHMVACAVYDNDGNALPYYMYPRSSISKTPLRLANSVGIIDSGYRGNLIAKLDHVKNDDASQDYHVEAGTRLIQVCSHNLLPFESVRIVDELDATERGVGGFGSTGR